MSPKSLHGIENDGSDPVYGDFDDDEYSAPKTKRPLWQSPKTDLEKKILACVNRKYYHDKNKELYPCRMIAKSVVSLETGTIAKYPTEWILHCIEVTEKLKKEGVRPTLTKLLKYFDNEEKKTKFLNSWHYKHKKPIRDAKPERDKKYVEEVDFKKLRGL